MPASTFLPTFSVCILTCDHPEGLQRALQAVAESTMPPHQLIVTDDSSGYATRETNGAGVAPRQRNEPPCQAVRPAV